MKTWTFRLLQPFIILAMITTIGIIGFAAIEHYNFLEAAYMTIISITTAGFQEVRPLSNAGRVFTMFLLITSWSTFAFAITRITQFVVSGEINKYFKIRKLMNSIQKMEDHVIVCGFGRNGQQAGHILKVHGVPFIVIEKDEEIIERLTHSNQHVLFLQGDSTQDEVLKQAGVARAKALITTLPMDADNVFIVLSARSLNEKIQIISRAASANSYAKLLKAGADSIIMPDKIGGTHMATLVSKPDVIEFIDYLSGEEGESINMESIAYDQLPKSIRDQPLSVVMQWRKTGVNCIGVKDTDGKFIINPPEETIITQGMKVIILGTKWQIDRMKSNLA